MNQTISFTEEQIKNAHIYIPKLKILNLYSKIIKSVEENLITFISSKTGSGKSTQVPKFLYEHLKKSKSSFCVICTEPRSIACNSLSEYIREQNPNIEIYTKSNIYDERYGPTLLFLKESDLLYLLKEDPYLKKCDILIIDEVHERTMKLDLILYYLKHFTLNKENRERGFKLVFMSATFNTDDIYSYFSSIDNQNLTFGFIDQNDLRDDSLKEDNYQIIYSNTINNYLCYGNTKFNEYNMGKLLREISKIVRYHIYLNDGIKTILVFLPDYKSIYSLSNLLRKEYVNYINVYQFCSAISPDEQKSIIDEFSDGNKKVV